MKVIKRRKKRTKIINRRNFSEMVDIYQCRECEFDKSAIYEKIDKIQAMLDEEMSKSEEERDRKREKELIYAKFIQGLKLSTQHI